MSITASEARQNLFPLIEQVNEDRAPVHITSRRGNAVLMSEEDFTSWTETVHLLRSPKNARRLLDSIAGAEAGQARNRALIDPDAERAWRSRSRPTPGRTTPTGPRATARRSSASTS
ncbi:type II toxin-antitoxin system Phd/YefM family antitoxin [Streptomyces sp. NEAU-W12]|uniref:type II toxin-antitoxin system Phd/YefM family antitoxin n=1 Tax=Streptomyces sp. NEAU-W12 TaxID=2994668 RepID=UPI003A4C8236